MLRALFRRVSLCICVWLAGTRTPYKVRVRQQAKTSSVLIGRKLGLGQASDQSERSLFSLGLENIIFPFFFLIFQISFFQNV
jgi:hypothetical protein